MVFIILTRLNFLLSNIIKMNLELIIIFGINFLFYSLIINYLKKLEEIGCDCAMNFKRKYILYFTTVNLVFLVLSLLTNVFTNLKKNKQLYSVFKTVYSLSSLLNIFYTIQYVNELKRINCDCSDDMVRDVMYIFSVIDAFMVFISFIMVVSVITTIITHTELKKHKSLKK